MTYMYYKGQIHPLHSPIPLVSTENSRIFLPCTREPLPPSLTLATAMLQSKEIGRSRAKSARCNKCLRSSIILNFRTAQAQSRESKRSRWENLISEIKRTSRKYQWRWSQVGSVSTMKRVNQRLCADQKKKQTRFEVVTGALVSRGTTELEAGFKLCFNLSRLQSKAANTSRDGAKKG